MCLFVQFSGHHRLALCFTEGIGFRVKSNAILLPKRSAPISVTHLLRPRPLLPFWGKLLAIHRSLNHIFVYSALHPANLSSSYFPAVLVHVKWRHVSLFAS